MNYLFYTYGRKKRIAARYPLPVFDTIIEPFAGSAAYSLHKDNWRKNVILVEKDQRVAQIWKWLITEATPKEIMAMPDLKVGQKTSNLLHILHAATKQAFYYKTIKVTPVLERNWRINKRHMAQDLHKVKHWTLISGDYTDAPDIDATWFVDPPYQYDSGLGYHHGSSQLDYAALARWVLERKGQVICCEGPKATYLPFKPLLTMNGVAGKKSKEMIYHRINDRTRLVTNSLEPFLIHKHN